MIDSEEQIFRMLLIWELATFLQFCDVICVIPFDKSEALKDKLEHTVEELSIVDDLPTCAFEWF